MAKIEFFTFITPYNDILFMQSYIINIMLPTSHYHQLYIE